MALPIAQWCVATGDADGVEPAGAELLVARGGNKAGPRRGTGLPVVHAWKHRGDKDGEKMLHIKVIDKRVRG